MMLSNEALILIENHPRMYHMAERGSWPSIKKHGLLSTTALLDLYKINGEEREAIEALHRPAMTYIEHPKIGNAAIRDQIPMPDGRLERALEGTGITASEWYQFLNKKVFFWATKERLDTLLGSRSYRNKEHDVLVVDTKSFLTAHQERVELCHMNSGNTFPIPHARDYGVFKPLNEYARVLAGRIKKKAVAEIVVDYSVPDIAKHTESVIVRKAGRTLAKIE